MKQPKSTKAIAAKSEKITAKPERPIVGSAGVRGGRLAAPSKPTKAATGTLKKAPVKEAAKPQRPILGKSGQTGG